MSSAKHDRNQRDGKVILKVVTIARDMDPLIELADDDPVRVSLADGKLPGLRHRRPGVSAILVKHALR